MDSRTHWEKIYGEKAPNTVSWYRPHLETSLSLIARVASRDSAIIDVGGGESTLVDDLLSHGHDAGIAQFCLLSAAGGTARSRFRYVRVMGMKEDTVRNVGFARLAIFRPGIIVGNAHTPAWVGWLGSLVPGSFGNIDQRILGRSIAAEIALHSRDAGEVTRENAAMEKLAAQFNSVP